MGFSFKVAPGVRIRASSRGVRTSVGPRAARVHFGSGRTGISTGAGPVSFYSSLGGSRGGSRSGGQPPSIASYQRQLAAAEKAEEAQRLAAAFQRSLMYTAPSFLRPCGLWRHRLHHQMQRRCGGGMSVRLLVA
jgi:hypothetical protein